MLPTNGERYGEAGGSASVLKAISVRDLKAGWNITALPARYYPTTIKAIGLDGAHSMATAPKVARLGQQCPSRVPLRTNILYWPYAKVPTSPRPGYKVCPEFPAPPWDGIVLDGPAAGILKGRWQGHTWCPPTPRALY